jgi:Na+-transporting NADH:ubiquinone oxidoreductase subunit NqrB
LSTVADTWLGEALGRLHAELKLFARTFVAFVLRPGHSARSWQAGDSDFMNPLAFGATAAGIYWALSNTLNAVWRVPGSQTADTLGGELASAISPYLMYGLLGTTMHFALRLLGSRRRLLGSVGIALFVGGSIGTLGALLTSSVARRMAFVRGTTSLEMSADDFMPLLLFLGATLFYVLTCLLLARALKALHHTSLWKVVFAAVFGMVLTAVLFGTVIPEGNYGWHPYIGIETDNQIGFSFGFRG